MNLLQAGSLPLLPLILHRTPPGLEIILNQAGIPWVSSDEPQSLSLGRFVLVDGAQSRHIRSHRGLTAEHVMIDLVTFRSGWKFDPFAALLDTRPGYRAWQSGAYRLVERVSRVDRARIRVTLLKSLRAEIERAGGVLACLSPFPYPYRSAFNLRIDLDEPAPADYQAMATARRPLNDCSTHFVCTSAYGRFPEILADLRGLDSHSHGHHHVVSRDPSQNLQNLTQADVLLRAAGMEPVGYAGPEGRWNPGLNGVIEQLGYEFSGEFQLGFDDLPFWPWLGNRFSSVLQIPVHPISEGLFLEAGATTGQPIADHLSEVVERKLAAGEPAFVYGHPEGRLGRFPEILDRLAQTVAAQTGLWRTTQKTFARWWVARARQRWCLHMSEPGILRFEFQPIQSAWIPTIQIQHGNQTAEIAVREAESTVPLSSLDFRPSPEQPSEREAPIIKRPISLRGLLRHALDWDTVTPIEDLPETTLSLRARKWIRSARESSRRSAEPTPQ